VFVRDVADAVCAALETPAARGHVYELGGPQVYTFKELMQLIRAETERRVPLIPLPFFLAHPLGLLLGWTFALIPFADPPLTGDQVTMLKRDNVVGADANAQTIQDLGITQLETVEAIVPAYLWRFRPYGQFQTRQTPA
jgi:NADH dehydrogenase